MTVILPPRLTPMLDLERIRHAAWLSPKAKLEPLMDRWPLWPHLLAPAQYAMNLSGRLIPLLKSFLANPRVHAQAAEDPMLFGGPFVALSSVHLDAARALLDHLEAAHAGLLGFAADFKALDRSLVETSGGYSLDRFYADLPASMAGLVELVYDLKNNPKIRIFEDLLYAAMPTAASQSFCLHVVGDRQREFFMNTPFVDAKCGVFLDVPYQDPLVETLSRARLAPGIPDAVLDAVVSSGAAGLEEMFTFEAPERRNPDYDGPGVRIRYFGHACVLLQTSEASVLVDPVTAWERDEALASLTFDDLPDFIDVVVISHCHQDHLVAETLLQLRGRISMIIVPPNDRGNLADPSMRLILRELGFDNVAVLDLFQSYPVKDGAITSLPFVGEHGGVDIASKHAALVTLRGQRLLFMVDSDAVDPRLSERIAERVGPIDVLFLGMECEGAPMSWLYGPLLGQSLGRKNDQSRRFSGSDAERAWSAVQRFGCGQAFVYAMGQEPWMRHLMGLEYQPDSIQLQEADKFLARCGQAGIKAARLYGARAEILPPRGD